MNVVGHAWAVKRLQDAIARETLAQSHLFVGPPSVGKATLACEVAAELLARRAADPARARRLVGAGKHPDLNWVGLQPEKARISIEQVRELMRTLSLTPVESAHRVGVIEEAHLASEEGQNALLKTLEEPNPSVVLILIAPSPEGLLGTIASRCQVLSLRAVSTRDIESELERRQVEPERAATLARFARGRVGWALRAADDPELLDQRQKWADDMRRLTQSNRTQRFAYAESLARESLANLQDVLVEWQMFWRDMLGREPAAAAAALRALALADKRVRQNANARLALDALMLTLPTD